MAVDPFTMGAIGGGLDILGGIFGNIFSSGEREEAERLMQQAFKRIESLPIPDIQKRIIYQQYQSSGDLTPESLQKTLEEHVPPKLLQEEQANKIKQEAALSALEQITKTGMGAQDRLALEQARRQAAQDAQARISSIRSQMGQRGQGGSGAELAMMLSGAQAADDRQAMENMQAASSAADRRARALQDVFAGRSQIRAADLDVNKYNVGAENAYNRFLAQNAMNRQLQNAQMRQEANLRNLQNRQNLANMNVEQYNREQQRLGHDAKLQQYNMELAKRQALSGMQGQQAAQKMGQAQNTAQSWASIGKGGGDILRGMAAQENADRDYELKKKVFGV